MRYVLFVCNHNAGRSQMAQAYLDWAVADPAGQDLATVRVIRQDIADHVLDLLKELLP